MHDMLYHKLRITLLWKIRQNFGKSDTTGNQCIAIRFELLYHKKTIFYVKRKNDIFVPRIVAYDAIDKFSAPDSDINPEGKVFKVEKNFGIPVGFFFSWFSTT